MKKPVTVIDKMSEECRIAAVEKRMPIIWLKTSHLELVTRIVMREELLPLLNIDLQYSCKPMKNTVESYQPVWTGINERFCNLRVMSFKDIYTHFSGVKHDENHKDLSTSVIREMVCNEKHPPCLYIVKSDCGDERYEKKYWDGLLPFINAHCMDEYAETVIGNSLIIIYGENPSIPNDYRPYCHIVDEPYPDKNELKDMVDSILGGLNYDIKEILPKLQGFSLMRAERMLKHLRRANIDTKEAIARIVAEREQELKSCDLLSLEDVPEGIKVAGMESFGHWMGEQKKYLEESDKLMEKTGSSVPKGVLLCGIPGSGKSAAAKMFSDITKLPLLRMDLGKLMGGIVGESEHNMDKALKIADATAPCILFIDELDKAFEGAKSNSGNGSDSTFKRMFANLLTWMQDHKSPCFVFATANDISVLPKEFFRSGRFDAMYSLFMPTYEECKAVCEYHLKKRVKDNAIFECNVVADGITTWAKNSIDLLWDEKLWEGDNAKEKVPRFVTGADIEKLVEHTLRKCYSKIGSIDKKTEKEIRTISPGIWNDSFKEVLSKTSVYGDSEEQKDAIALCYIRLLRNNFVPVSSDLIILPEGYKVTRTKNKGDKNNHSGSDSLPEFNVELLPKKGKMSEYDEKLYEMLKERIEQYGPAYERELLKKMLNH